MYHYTTIPFPKHPKMWGKHQSIHFLQESHGEITITFACRWRTICKACPITLNPQNRWLHHARKEHNFQIESCMYTSVLRSKNTKSWMLFLVQYAPSFPIVVVLRIPIACPIIPKSQEIDTYTKYHPKQQRKRNNSTSYGLHTHVHTQRTI